jgi:hypothetical protein
VFLSTGSSCVFSEEVSEVFSGKSIAMMHECKRLLNRAATEQGLLFATRGTRRKDVVPMQAFLVPQEAADANEHVSEAESDATEHADQGDKDIINGKQRSCSPEPATHTSEAESDATEHADQGDDEIAHGEQRSGAHRASARPATIAHDATERVVASSFGETISFTKTLTPHDDWLRRGVDLQDVDKYHDTRYIERVEMPRKGNARGFQKRFSVCHQFDKHYPMSKTYVKHAHAVQNVGSQCARSDVNQGEEDAIYKSAFWTCVHCPGSDECANPLIYGPMLFPYDEDIDESNNADKPTATKRFAPAWKARRAEIEVLADRAALKHDMAKRIGVIRGCAAFKGVLLSNISLAQAKTIDRSAATERATNLSADADTEHVFDVRMQQIIIQQLVRQTWRRATCLERVMTGVMVYLGVPLPWRPDQAHIAEWQAYSARELFSV